MYKFFLKYNYKIAIMFEITRQGKCYSGCKVDTTSAIQCDNNNFMLLNV